MLLPRAAEGAGDGFQVSAWGDLAGELRAVWPGGRLGRAFFRQVGIAIRPAPGFDAPFAVFWIDVVEHQPCAADAAMRVGKMWIEPFEDKDGVGKLHAEAGQCYGQLLA